MSSSILVQITHAEIRPAGETSRIMVQEVVGSRTATVEAAMAFDPTIAAEARRIRDTEAELPVAADFFDRSVDGQSSALVEAMSAEVARRTREHQ